MSEDFLDYGKLINDAMYHVVRSALEIVKKTGLIEDHHFFITFNTRHSGVMISDELKKKYPHEMTIVIQHQFWNLEIDEQHFSIVLSFENVKQSLTVPFESLISFADPSVKFGLQFSNEHIDFDDEEADISHPHDTTNSDIDKPKGDNSNVVTLDSFRKK